MNASEALPYLEAFARRFGENHVILAMHAAVPLGLTSELLHLLRVNFVREADWIGEADLLLSPLCREVGGELYEMEPAVRALLLDELQQDAEFTRRRTREVAEFVEVYAQRARPSSPEMHDFFQALQWAAIAENDPATAARELARALHTGLEKGNPAEALRIVQLTSALSMPLFREEEFVGYAVTYDRLARGENIPADGGAPLSQTAVVGDVTLPALDTLFADQILPPEPPPKPVAKPTIFISYSRKDVPWKAQLDPYLQALGVELEIWSDEDILPAQAWRGAITDAIERAVVAVLFVTADYLASKWIMQEEIPQLLRRRDAGHLVILPVIVKPCPWTRVPWLAAIQTLPGNGRALMLREDGSPAGEGEIARDLSAIAEEIATLLERARSASEKPAPESPPADDVPAPGPPADARTLNDLERALQDIEQAPGLMQIYVELIDQLHRLEFGPLAGLREALGRGFEDADARERLTLHASELLDAVQELRDLVKQLPSGDTPLSWIEEIERTQERLADAIQAEHLEPASAAVRRLRDILLFAPSRLSGKMVAYCKTLRFEPFDRIRGSLPSLHEPFDALSRSQRELTARAEKFDQWEQLIGELQGLEPLAADPAKLDSLWSKLREDAEPLLTPTNAPWVVAFREASEAMDREIRASRDQPHREIRRSFRRLERIARERALNVNAQLGIACAGLNALSKFLREFIHNARP